MKLENDKQNETEEPEIKRIRQGKGLYYYDSYEEKTEISCMHFNLFKSSTGKATFGISLSVR